MTTVSSSSSQAQVALSLISASTTTSGVFSAISGTASASKSQASASAIFNAIVPGSTGSSISATLQQEKVTTQTNSIYSNVASRVSAMEKGTYTASSDWEKVVSYNMQTGVPVMVSLDSSGKVQALPQSETDLTKKYNVHQQSELTTAISQISTMAGKIQANAKNDTWVADLAGAANDLEMVHSGALNAETSWEEQGSLLMTDHQPFKISLDSTGNLQVTEQLTDSMSDLTPTQQTLLRKAVETIPGMISKDTPTTSWQIDAQNYDSAGIPYYLDIDPVTNKISAKENSADNITSSFLKTEPYPDIGDNTALLKQVATYVKKKQAYFLDFDSTGKIVAKALTATNLEKYNQTSTTTSSTAGSIVSLFA